MKTIILEGIATSGKSTIIELLPASLGEAASIKVVPETETLMPIVDNLDKTVSINYLTNLIDSVYTGDVDIVIFDRLYLTHIFRTHSDITDFRAIEEMLRPFMPETIFLKVDEDAIAKRVAKAAEHREPEWKEYIFTKGQSIEEIADYYIHQQQNQLKVLEQSTLPYHIFNTTNHEYQAVIDEIHIFYAAYKSVGPVG